MAFSRTGKMRVVLENSENLLNSSNIMKCMVDSKEK